jgi:hypothetical protein
MSLVGGKVTGWERNMGKSREGGKDIIGIKEWKNRSERSVLR